MNKKVQKYREELEKIETKMTALKERGKTLEAKIREEETLEITALMRSEGLTMSELIALARSRKENQGFPSFDEKSADVADEEAEDEHGTGMDGNADSQRDEYMEDEDDEDYE